MSPTPRRARGVRPNLITDVANAKAGGMRQHRDRRKWMNIRPEARIFCRRIGLP